MSLGEWAIVPAPLSGRLLRYFIPSVPSYPCAPQPLSPQGECQGLRRRSAVGLAMNRVLAGRRGGSSSDGLGGLQSVLLECHSTTRPMLSQIRWRWPSLLAGRKGAQRDCDAYPSAATPADAEFLYAPPAAIERGLVEACSRVQASWTYAAEPEVIARLFFFLVHLHPFFDGNGRWARALICRAVSGAGAPDFGPALALWSVTEPRKFVGQMRIGRESGDLGPLIQSVLDFAVTFDGPDLSLTRELLIQVDDSGLNDVQFEAILARWVSRSNIQSRWLEKIGVPHPVMRSFLEQSCH